jgi:hypothetical protein
VAATKVVASSCRGGGGGGGAPLFGGGTGGGAAAVPTFGGVCEFGRVATSFGPAGLLVRLLRTGTAGATSSASS